MSGTGVARDFLRTTGRSSTRRRIAQAARAGDAQAARRSDAFIDRLGRALAMVCNLIDPDVFVFGGGLSNLPEIYDRVAPVIERHVFSDAWTAMLAPARWAILQASAAPRAWPRRGRRPPRNAGFRPIGANLSAKMR